MKDDDFRRHEGQILETPEPHRLPADVFGLAIVALGFAVALIVVLAVIQVGTAELVP